MHGQACPKDAARFPALQRALAHAVMDYIRSGAEPAERMIRHLVECELDYINCDHPEFIGSRAAIRQVVDERSMRAGHGQHQGLIHREDSRGSSGSQQQQSSGKENASMASNGGTTNGAAGVGPSRGNKISPVLAAAEGGSKDKPPASGQNSLGLKVRINKNRGISLCQIEQNALISL